MGILKKQEEPEEIRLKHPKTKETIIISNIVPQLDIYDKNMMKAKVKYKDGETFNICFRNPQNVNPRHMRETNLFVGLLRYGALDNLEQAKYNYLGTILYDKEKKNNPYKILMPTQRDEEYVKKHMDTQLEIFEEKEKIREEQEREIQEQEEWERQQRIKEEKRRLDEEEFSRLERSIKFRDEFLKKYGIESTTKESKDFKKDIKISEQEKQKIDNYLNNYFQNKQKNIENPFLRISNMKRENLEEINFEGVDITTGDFLILKNLKQKLIDQKYIYTGYLTYVDKLEEIGNKTKEELEAYEVIFELPYSMNEITEEKNVNSVLQLLSKSETLLKRYRLNMLGKVQDDGMMQRPPYEASKNIFTYYKQKAREVYQKNKYKNKTEREIIE